MGQKAHAQDEQDEAVLMRRIGEGDSAAYRVMADRYLGRIASFAQRVLGGSVEAEDVAQDTFLRLWTEAARWTPQAKPSTWLFRIAHNLCIDRLRRRRSSDAAALERESGGEGPGVVLARKELAAVVALALAELPERQRAAITLVHYEGMGNIEAAAVLEIGVDAMESLLARARRSLRERLAGLEDDRGVSA